MTCGNGSKEHFEIQPALWGHHIRATQRTALLVFEATDGYETLNTKAKRDPWER
jgi:hypothetical protein